MEYRTLHWKGDATGSLWMIDQTLLPTEFREIECWTAEGVWEAIKMLRVRGAPAIGVAAAMGIALGALHVETDDWDKFPMSDVLNLSGWINVAKRRGLRISDILFGKTTSTLCFLN